MVASEDRTEALSRFCRRIELITIRDCLLEEHIYTTEQRTSTLISTLYSELSAKRVGVRVSAHGKKAAYLDNSLVSAPNLLEKENRQSRFFSCIEGSS